jgi:hypothetical protein
VWIKAYDENNVGKTVRFSVEGIANNVTHTLTNQWVRVSAPAGAANTTAAVFIVETRGTLTTQTADVLMWNGTVEAGAFLTSDIITGATTATRNADVATMTGTNFSDWWQATTGAAAARALPSTVSGTRPVIQFDDNTADNFITLRGNTTNPELYIKAATDQAQIDAGTISANTAYTLAGSWNTDSCAAALNGAVAITDASATIPTVTQARLGSDGTNYLNGHLQTVRYWPQRLINAEVQAFSKL